MELKDTVGLMLSDDYEDRLDAEHQQCVIRLEKLTEYITKIAQNGKKESFSQGEAALMGTLYAQKVIMEVYRNLLEERMEFEEIEC